MITTILLHKIRYSWVDGSNSELQESDYENIKFNIEQGIRGGELCQSFTNIDEAGKGFDDERRGWWKII